MGGVSFPKPKTFRSEEYLAFVRTQPCVVCAYPAEAHHVFGGGKGLKCDDRLTIPLCRVHHAEHDYVGKESFYRNHNLNRWELIAKTLIAYLQESEG